MRLKSATEDKKFDVRLQDKLVSEGKLTKAELEKYLKSLPDDEGNYLSIEDVTKRMGAGPSLHTH